MPETEEYGISSFVYRARGPFEPAKLHAFFARSWPGVVRAKGFFWLATRPEWVGELSQAGAFVRNEAIGYWWAAVPKDNWPDDDDLIARINKGWHRLWVTAARSWSSSARATWTRRRSSRRSTPACSSCRPRARSRPRAGPRSPDPFPEWRRDAA